MALVLVDTAVWVDHFQVGVPELLDLLEHAQVCTHPLVIGELALGSIKDRAEVLDLMAGLPTVTEADHAEVLRLIETHRLPGTGVSLLDVQLLAAVLLSPDTVLWTHDKRLRTAATAAGAWWA